MKSGLFNLNSKKNNSDCHETAKLSAKSGVLKMALPISDLKDCSNASDSEKSWVILKAILKIAAMRRTVKRAG